MDELGQIGNQVRVVKGSELKNRTFIRVKSNTASDNSLVVFDKLLLVISFVYPLFRGLVGASPIALLVSIVAAAVFSIRNFNTKTVFRFNHLLWLIIASFAIGAYIFLGPNQALNPVRLVSFVYTILFMLLLCGSKTWIKPAMNILLGMLTIHALATLLLFIFPSLYTSVVKPIFFEGVHSAWGYQSGLTSHYSYNGMLMSAGVIASFSRVVGGFPTQRRWLSPLLLVLFIICLLLTAKRGPLICVVLSIAIAYFVFSGKLKFRAISRVLIGFLLLLIVFLVVARCIPSFGTVFERLVSAIESDSFDVATSNRTLLWNHAIDLWQQSPVFGHGWGSYRFYWPGSSSGEAATITAHNIYLNLLAEVGITGLVVFLVASILPMVYAFRVCNHNALVRCDLSEIAIFSLGYQLFFLTYGLSGAPLYDVECYFIYFIFACSAIYAVAPTVNGSFQDSRIQNVSRR